MTERSATVEPSASTTSTSASLTRELSDILTEHKIRRDDWNAWRWQVKNKITTVDALRGWIDPSPAELEAIDRCVGKYRWSISPYYASLMDPEDPSCPIRQQAVPQLAEFDVVPSAD